MAKVSSQIKLAPVSNVAGSKKKHHAQKQLKRLLLGSLLPILLILFWEFASQVGLVESYQLPAPSVILVKLSDLTASGELFGHVSITVYRVFIGFTLGSIVAIIVGLLVGFSKNAEYLFDPIIQAFRSIPSLAWVPLFILWMGIGESSKVTMIAVGVFFPVYLNLVSGIISVDRKLIEVGKMFKLSLYQQIRQIIFPATLPSLLVGLRSGLGLGWMFVVAAELMGASQGLGYLLVLGQNTLSPEVILISIILFAVIGKTSDWLLKVLEDHFLSWQDRFVTTKAR